MACQLVHHVLSKFDQENYVGILQSIGQRLTML